MQDQSLIIFFLAALIIIVLTALVLVFIAWQRERRRSQARIEQLLSDHQRTIMDARRESVEKSRSSLKGQIAEQLAPLLPGFLYLPADARFLGDPIDYVVFNGYTGLRDDRTSATTDLDIVLLEVKQGASTLSPFQRAIAKSVQEGRVRFEILRISEDGVLSSETWRPRRAAGSGPLP